MGCVRGSVIYIKVYVVHMCLGISVVEASEVDGRSLEVSKGLHLAYSPTSTNEQSSEQV